MPTPLANRYEYNDHKNINAFVLTAMWYIFSQTVYFAKCFKEDVNTAMDILSDM